MENYNKTNNISISHLDHDPIVLRLDAKSRPIMQHELEILQSINANILEVEDLRSNELTSEALEKVDAVMVCAKKLPASDIQRMKRCRIICKMGVGVDKIDVMQATKQGILVANLPGFAAQEVADHTMALLLASARRLKEFESGMRQGYRLSALSDSHIHRLSDCVLGIIGFGNIGKGVAKRAQGFGMSILVCDPAISKETEEKNQVRAVELEELLRLSDFVVLVCPLTLQTMGMLKAKQFRMMKKSSVLINTGRGGLINEDDLYNALKNEDIRFAALDVFDGIDVQNPDGFKTDHPFFSLSNVMLTPHMAAVSVETLYEQRKRSAQTIKEVLSGQWPENLVNPEVIPWFCINKSGW